MRLNPAAFDRHLNHMGQKVLWRRSYACACTNPASGAPDPKHQLCGGKGRIWNDPVETVTGVASQKTLAQWMATGKFEAGDAVLSIPQASVLWEAGRFDRVTMLNATDVFSQSLVRGAPSERLLFNVVSVTRVFWLDPTTRLPVEGAAPSFGPTGLPTWPAQVQAELVADGEILADGSEVADGVVLLPNGEPPPGATYSITGTRNVEFFLYDEFPNNRNEHQGARLPKRVVARKWDLFGR